MAKSKKLGNKYAHLNEPQVEVDYHGLGPWWGEAAILEFTSEKIDEFRKKGLKVVRLIVGKGLHSDNGPVVKPVVVNYLRELEIAGKISGYSFDKAFGTGPNDGAIIVKL